MKIKVKVNRDYKGPVLSDFKVGQRVRRSRRWRWDVQDCSMVSGKPTDGSVVEIRGKDKAYPILVNWDGGKTGHGYDPIDLIIVKRAINGVQDQCED